MAANGTFLMPINASSLADFLDKINTTEQIRRSSSRNPICVAMLSYGLPILGCFGVIGNVASFMIMMSKRMRSTPYSVYIAALAVMDMMNLFYFMSAHYFTPILRIKFVGLLRYCNGKQWYVGGSVTAGAWVVIAMTCERLFSIYKPLESRMLFTVKRAIKIVCSLILVSYLLYVPALLFYSNHPQCSNRGKYYPGFLNWSWYREVGHTILMSATYSMVPSVALICLNAAIFIKMRQHARAKRSLIAIQQDKATATYNDVGRMVLTTSVIYTVLTVPFVISSLYYRIIGDQISYYMIRNPGQTLLVLMLDANHCINLIIYVLASPSVRATLFKACTSRIKGRTTNTSSATRSTNEFDLSVSNTVSVAGNVASQSEVSLNPDME